MFEHVGINGVYPSVNLRLFPAPPSFATTGVLPHERGLKEGTTRARLHARIHKLAFTSSTWTRKHRTNSLPLKPCRACSCLSPKHNEPASTG